MSSRVLGIEHLNYVNKEGRTVTGYNLYLGYSKSTAEGICTFKEYCKEGVLEGVEVGDFVDLFYDKFGKVVSVNVITD